MIGPFYNQPCPSCGHCPTCGRSGQHQRQFWSQPQIGQQSISDWQKQLQNLGSLGQCGDSESKKEVK